MALTDVNTQVRLRFCSIRTYCIYCINLLELPFAASIKRCGVLICSINQLGNLLNPIIQSDRSGKIKFNISLAGNVNPRVNQKKTGLSRTYQLSYSFEIYRGSPSCFSCLHLLMCNTNDPCSSCKKNYILMFLLKNTHCSFFRVARGHRRIFSATAVSGTSQLYVRKFPSYFTGVHEWSD